jgi:calcium-dependent protein kinase
MMAAKLDDYVIQRRLAPALFGDVLLCQHKPSGDMVAVKRVLQSAANAQLTLASNKKVRENVALERALYHQLNRVGGHRHVLKLRDEIEFDGYLYLVSDFCARGELYELVSSAQDGKLPLPAVTRYMRQIASGVQFLHANGFAHRDLSLENVLVTDDDQCQVCDFGLAASTAKPSRETVGKLFYMAPEVLAGVQYDATKADVWSLGVMLFIMLIGAPPVETASSADARFRLITNKGIRSSTAGGSRASSRPPPLTSSPTCSRSTRTCASRWARWCPTRSCCARVPLPLRSRSRRPQCQLNHVRAPPPRPSKHRSQRRPTRLRPRPPPCTRRAPSRTASSAAAAACSSTRSTACSRATTTSASWPCTATTASPSARRPSASRTAPEGG